MAKVPSILIIDCEPHLASIYAKRFDIDGWDVEMADSIDDAERKATKMKPDILLIDAQCAADLSEVIKRFRGLPTLLHQKMVVLAPDGERGKIQTALDAGADAYLILGHFVPQELVKKMKRLIEK